MTNKNLTFAEAIKKLEEINAWFQNEDIDLDKGLLKLQEGKELISFCRKKLKTVENEFIKIKDDATQPYEEKSAGKSEDSVEYVTTITEMQEETVVSTTDEIPF